MRAFLAARACRSPGPRRQMGLAGNLVDAKWLARAGGGSSIAAVRLRLDTGNDMVEKNIREFERLIETTVVLEGARYRKSMNRLRRDVQAFQKVCMAAAIAAPAEHKIFAAWLVEFAGELGGIDRAIGVTEAAFRGIPPLPAAPPCD